MKISLAILLLFLILLIGCGNASRNRYKKSVNYWLGKEIKLPYCPKIDYSNPSGLKIVTRINGNCYPCLKQLSGWKSFINEVSKEYSVSFYIYIVVSDSSIYENINEQEIHFDYPIIYDIYNDFQKLNKINSDNNLNSMLLNSNNEVLLIGNPVINKKMEELYVNTIRSVIEQ